MISSHRVSRCSAVAFAGLAAFSLAACGSSSTSSTASSSSSKPAASSSAASSSAAPASPTPAAEGQDRTSGLVGTVTGGTITLTDPHGPGTVIVSPSTRVRQLTAAQLTDVKAGQCAVVRPTKDSASSPSVTAAAVLFGPAENGQCAPPGPRQGKGVIGTVASVNGNSIVITATDNSQSTVTVTPDTRYAQRSSADTSAIAAGQCLLAIGTKGTDGSIQAASVNVRPATTGQCGPIHQGG